MIKRHQPKHIYRENQIYFITSHIQHEEFRIDSDSKRDKLLLKIFSFAWENRIRLFAWAVLADHFHLLLKTPKSDIITKFVGAVHSGFSFEINQSEGARGRRLWKNYWDWCVRDESDYWQHFNYVHNNPIKHGIVSDLPSLKRYRYSSFWNYARRRGMDWLASIMEAYPIVDFIVENDE